MIKCNLHFEGDNINSMFSFVEVLMLFFQLPMVKTQKLIANQGATFKNAVSLLHFFLQYLPLFSNFITINIF